MSNESPLRAEKRNELQTIGEPLVRYVAFDVLEVGKAKPKLFSMGLSQLSSP